VQTQLDQVGAAIRRYRDQYAGAKDPHDLAALERTADEALTLCARRAVQEGLDDGRGRGKAGWWREEVVSDARLLGRLQAQMDSGDMVGTLTYAAMLLARQMAGQAPAP
jgi:hypothetical protein